MLVFGLIAKLLLVCAWDTHYFFFIILYYIINLLFHHCTLLYRYYTYM